MAAQDLSQDMFKLVASFAMNERVLLERIEALERGRQFDRNYPMIMKPGYNRHQWNTAAESLQRCDPRVALWVSVENVNLHVCAFSIEDNASLAAAVDAFHSTRSDLPKVMDANGIEKPVIYESYGFNVSAGLLRAFIRVHNVWEYIPHNRDRVGAEVSVSASDAEEHAGPLQNENLDAWRLSILKEMDDDIPPSW